jgi:calcineurin-like phosphoesterase family protein
MPIDNQWLRRIYLEELAREVEWHDGNFRAKARNPQKYAQVKSKHSHELKGFRDLRDVPSDKIWFTSDQHYGHKNIIEFSKRPFVGVGHMNQRLVELYNEKVAEDDVVIFVGDLAFGGVEMGNNVLSHLNGYKINVVGNHDFAGKKLMNLHFEETHLSYSLERDKQKLLITHYAFEEVPQGYRNIHGHIHAASFEIFKGEEYYNVNVEFSNYAPVKLQTILDCPYQYQPVFENTPSR